jgi:hypothetical protein
VADEQQPPGFDVLGKRLARELEHQRPEGVSRVRVVEACVSDASLGMVPRIKILASSDHTGSNENFRSSTAHLPAPLLYQI